MLALKKRWLLVQVGNMAYMDRMSLWGPGEGTYIGQPLLILLVSSFKLPCLCAACFRAYIALANVIGNTMTFQFTYKQP